MTDEASESELTRVEHPSRAYLAPPVIRRIATLRAEVPSEVFERHREGWKSAVRAEFPVEDPLVQWRLNMEEEDGVPRFDKIQPELRITERFYRKESDRGRENLSMPNFDFAMRCPAGGLEIHMGTPPESGRSYANLRAECVRWFGPWLRQFEVERPRKVFLHYVNLLRRDVTPQLFAPNGSLALGDTLTIFAGIPGEHVHLEPPFDCKVGLRLDGAEDGKLRIHVVDASGETGNRQVAIRVHFLAEAAIEEGGGVDRALGLLDWCHERIVERFELVFTSGAKRTFQPVEI